MIRKTFFSFSFFASLSAFLPPLWYDDGQTGVRAGRSPWRLLRVCRWHELELLILASATEVGVPFLSLAEGPVSGQVVFVN